MWIYAEYSLDCVPDMVWLDSFSTVLASSVRIHMPYALTKKHWLILSNCAPMRMSSLSEPRRGCEMESYYSWQMLHKWAQNGD